MTAWRVARVAAAALALALAALPPAHAARRNPVSVRIDRTEISTKLGHRFAFRSTIANRSPVPLHGLVAHLNVLSYDSGVYVDPEDWSSSRTRYLAPLPPGDSATITWRMQAVNAGSFAVYVAVLGQGPAAPATGARIHVGVARRTTLDPRGILPLTLGIPGALGLLALGARLRRKRA